MINLFPHDLGRNVDLGSEGLESEALRRELLLLP